MTPQILSSPELSAVNGISLRFKCSATLAATRLIVLTSMGHALRSAELKQLGIEAYLVKPVKQSRLFDCLISQARSRTTTEGVAGGQDPIKASSLGGPKMEPAFKQARILLAEDNASTKKSRLLNCMDCVTGPTP
jgi:two-component system, sensor histidine kinase and response regulator